MKKNIKQLIDLLQAYREPGDNFHDILQIIMTSVQADASTIYLEEDGDFWFAWSENNISSSWNNLYPGLKVKIKRESLAGYSAFNKKPLWVDNVYEVSLKKHGYTFDQSFDKKSNFKTKNSYTIPLLGNSNSILGVLQLINIKNLNFNYVKEVSCFLTNELEKICNLRRYILRLIKVAALRDPLETAEHVKRVAELSMFLRTSYGERICESRQEIIKARNAIFYAAMLHDIGKVGISDSILKKPGRLDPLERLEMEKHTTLGYNLLNDTAQTLVDRLSRDVILHHHQRFDGQGYPREARLAGSDIPLAARIVAIADVFDALTHERCYKQAFPVDVAQKMMYEGRGTQFDPELIDIFFELFDKKLLSI